MIFNSSQLIQTLPLFGTNKQNKQSSGNNENCQSLVPSNPTYIVSVTLSINSKRQVSQRPGAGTRRIKPAGHKGAQILDRSSYCLSGMWSAWKKTMMWHLAIVASRGLRVIRLKSQRVQKAIWGVSGQEVYAQTGSPGYRWVPKTPCQLDAQSYT